ncbi:two-component system response regulator NarL [Kushneria indalinina]|uniref:LuxR family two component transcriptional regulator n=1 Tax=Kushneria indalinina DSM 14324 TaxID=1122140 RepID=A0A3D9DXC0_9GAMM|nr:two-component system response regulator NarL [Kushneria indalinina]REC95019.1 LuxR family two component transcriptional regulator [Kushneria indalinina DSM 14324]
MNNHDMSPDDMSHRATPRGVLVVDDHPLFRRGVQQLLAMSASLSLAGEADSGAGALDFCTRHVPDLILLDMKMAGMDGIETLTRLREAGVTVPIVMLTVSEEQDDVLAAIRAGATGYLLKDTAPEELLAAIEALDEQEDAFDPRLMGLLTRALREPAPGPEALIARLTRRERDILRLIARSYANKEIGRRLDISEGTVKVHVRHLLKKMGMRTRTEAAVWAAQEGWK